MTVDDVIAALAGVTALRVFAPDMCKAARLLLRAGVQVGVSELLQNPARTPASTPQASHDQEA
ncbi:hypothetical protein [Streptomyces capitiformicae]|uniref:Uncharacterized protein n=1 Tax=Streptomyces capitiformicae TaxID=2014920 RepID=A0A918Z2L2_9ACTN|nr:hypothetical protein [Streptomyces capitiformicae]GHE33893.1 hypothetical protein GCM10017771_51170 [Streptomyces capitiformicae]